MRWLVWMAVVGCTSATVGLDDTDSPSSSDSDSGVVYTPPAPVCDASLTSACGNPRSIVQGQVRLGKGIDVTTGTLFLALMHEAYDGSVGGGYHISTSIPNADLTQPVPFAFDMCLGGEMWTEENCTYTLQVILDQDGDQSATNVLPDRGEPAARVSDLTLSCREEALCLDVVLDCTDGATCTSFTELPSCSCEQPTCASPIAICN